MARKTQDGGDAEPKPAVPPAETEDAAADPAALRAEAAARVGVEPAEVLAFRHRGERLTVVTRDGRKLHDPEV